jgi:hypothetical protein
MDAMRRVVEAGMVMTVFACSAAATPITYYFSGTSLAGSPTSNAIPAGTAFSGFVTFDPATPNSGGGDSQHRNFFDAGATFQFNIGSGLYDFSTASVGIEVDNDYGLNFGGGDVMWFWANSATITGTAQATDPLLLGVDITVLLWRVNLSGADTVFTTANTIDAAPLLNLSLWQFAGIDLTTQNGERFLLPFSVISTEPLEEVPEPGTIGLLSAGLLSLVCARRLRRRATSPA